MRSFFDHMTPWPRHVGALHLYALPDDAVGDRLEAISQALGDVAHLPRMPRPWLHLTVSRLAQFDDLSQRELTALADALTTELDAVSAFPLDLGAARATVDSVTCAAEPTPAWQGLVGAVRAAVASVYPDDAPPTAPEAPHISLAYATGGADDAEISRRLEGLPPVGEMMVNRVHLVSVTVRPELGTFDWIELANWGF